MTHIESGSRYPEDFILIYTEDLFQAIAVERFPELEPWLLYMRNRYAFLK